MGLTRPSECQKKRGRGGVSPHGGARTVSGVAIKGEGGDPE